MPPFDEESYVTPNERFVHVWNAWDEGSAAVNSHFVAEEVSFMENHQTAWTSDWWHHILHIIALFGPRTVALAVAPRTEESLQNMKIIIEKLDSKSSHSILEVPVHHGTKFFVVDLPIAVSVGFLVGRESEKECGKEILGDTWDGRVRLSKNFQEEIQKKMRKKFKGKWERNPKNYLDQAETLLLCQCFAQVHHHMLQLSSWYEPVSWGREIFWSFKSLLVNRPSMSKTQKASLISPSAVRAST